MSTLFSPIQLRGLKLANRIMVAPMCQYSAVNGEANDWHFTHINTLALSGAAMFCIEATHVEAVGRITPGCLGLWNEATEAALRPIIASVRKHSKTAVAMQIAHAGRKGSSHVPWDGGQQIPLTEGGWQTQGPSAVPHKEGELPPLAFDAPGLARVREAFVAAARRAERLGLDALEVHSAHGYLLHQFLSPISNKRTDQYGGSLQNRMRYPLEVFDAVRAAFADHKPVGVKLSATDWVEGGWDLAQTIEYVEGIEEARRRLDRRLLGRGVAIAEDSARSGLSGAVRERHQGSDRRHYHGGRPDHRSKAGRGDRGVRQRRHGRAGPRHALRPALGLARRRRTRWPGGSPAAILALATLDAKGAVRRDHGSERGKEDQGFFAICASACIAAM